MIETGYELLDAIINNPFQAVAFFAIIYVGYKFFCGCHGFWAEMRQDIKFELKYTLVRPFNRKIDKKLWDLNDC